MVTLPRNNKNGELDVGRAKFLVLFPALAPGPEKTPLISISQKSMIIGREDENETAKLLPHELCLGPVGFVPNGSRSFIVDILCL